MELVIQSWYNPTSKMPDDVFQKIKIIEEKAAEIIEAARRNSSLKIKRSSEQFDQEVRSLIEQAKMEEADILSKAGQDAKAQGRRIAESTQQEINEIKKRSSGKTTRTKEELLKWLS